MKRLLAVLLSALVIAGLAVPTVSAADRVAPRVVVIVGPSGAATDRYRRLAEAAADEAERLKADVVRLYSPNATWPAVKRALQGASVVVYLGHGNGWPSRYSGSLSRTTQNGLGLNPVAGMDDDSHQYFGESFIADDVTLAPNAVVVMSHLCYASGNTEPGLPEGSLEDARQRVDNYAAGWLAAGARAVIAEAHAGPTEYVRALLGGKGALDGIWRGSRMFNGNVSSFRSERTPGAVALMDPVRESSGFYRSMVLRPGLRAEQVRAGARGARPLPMTALPAIDGETLAATGATVSAPVLAGNPVAGSRTTLTLPVDLPQGEDLPKGLQLGIRWYPLDVEDLSEPDAGPIEEPGATSPAGDDPSEPPADVDNLGLVQAEVAGSVVEPQAASRTAAGLRVASTLPESPGLYRVVTTLHDAEGVALDSASQALVPALLVRVTGTKSAAFTVAASLALGAATSRELKVEVVNTGSATWSAPEILDPRRPDQAGEAPTPTWLVGRWLPLTGTAPVEGVSVVLPSNIKPGERVAAALDLVAPEIGEYLLVLDVVTPADGSLLAAGASPTFVRVTVGTAPSDSDRPGGQELG